MATGIQPGTARGVYRIVLWDAAALDSEADVETEHELTERERAVLAHADSLALKITLGAETGSGTFDVDSVSYSKDGSVWGLWDNFTDVTLAAAGESRIDLTKKLLHATHIRVDASSVTLSGSAFFAASTIAIEAAVKDMYGL